MDSKFTDGNTLPSSLECQLAHIYLGKKEKFTVELVPIQQQEGGEDCDVFAITFAVSMCKHLEH